MVSRSGHLGSERGSALKNVVLLGNVVVEVVVLKSAEEKRRSKREKVESMDSERQSTDREQQQDTFDQNVGKRIRNEPQQQQVTLAVVAPAMTMNHELKNN